MKYKLTLTKYDKVIFEFEASNKTEANKAKRYYIKDYKLTRQKGFYGNAKTGIELITNY